MQATVVSLLPYPILREHKPHLTPAEYNISAAPENGMSILVVEDGTRGVYLDEDRGTENVVVSGEVIARSLVEDYIQSQPGQDQEAGPGLFYVKGALREKEIIERFPNKVQNAKKSQKDWWRRLVRFADDLWTRNHQMREIGDLERTAGRALGLKRDWLDDNPDTMMKCPVCTTLISNYAIVCFACHVILKPEEYKKFQFAGGANPVQALNAKI